MSFEPKKRCRSCGMLKGHEHFQYSPKNSDGMISYCNACMVLRANQNAVKPHARTLFLINRCKQRAARKGLPFNLDEHFGSLHGEMIRGCALTGLPFDLATGKGKLWNGPSIDRIKAERGYVRSNVRMVLGAMNSLLGSWGEEIAADMARKWLEKRNVNG